MRSYWVGVGATNTVILMMEGRLEECFAAVGDAPEISQQRIIAKQPSWELLDKSPQGLLLLALNKEQVPEISDDGKPGSSINRTRNKRRGGKRRGRMNAKLNPVEMLEPAEDVAFSESQPDAYRLAVLLVHKTLNADSWDVELDPVLTELRQSCENGIHPIWAKLAEKTPILAQMAAFKAVRPKIVKSLELNAAWLSATNIDPQNMAQLATLINTPLGLSIDSETELALSRLQKTLENRKSNQGSEWFARNQLNSLKSLTGQGVLVSAILLAAGGNSSAESKLEEAIEEVPAAKEAIEGMQLLLSLRSGNSENAVKAIDFPGEHGLASALKVVGWQTIDLQSAVGLKEKQISLGLEIINSAGLIAENLLWAKLSVMHSSSDIEESENLLSSMKIVEAEHLQIALDVLSKSKSESGTLWLAEQINGLGADALVSVTESVKLPLELRSSAAKKLQAMDKGKWKKVLPHLVPLYILESDSVMLTKSLMAINESTSYPWETILAYHLHPAISNNNTVEWLNESHAEAIALIGDVKTPECFTPLVISLLSVLEGLPDDYRVVMAEILDRNGYKAFNACRFSFSNPDAYIRSSDLEKLNQSISDVELSNLERELFNAVVENITLNIATLVIEREKSVDEMKRIDLIISKSTLRQCFREAVDGMVFEQLVPLPSLVSWYQSNDPANIHHIIAKGAVLAAKGDRIGAARAFSQAGTNNSILDYDQRMPLLRSSIIHFVHAGAWKDAHQLLQSEAALGTALTPKFKLYLNSSYLSNQGQQEKATSIIRDFVVYDRIIESEDVEGNIQTETRKEWSLEDLDRLMRYAPSRKLPTEPFCGRVRAALTKVEQQSRRGRRSKVFEIERRFDEYTKENNLDDLYDMASEMAEDEPTKGLGILERAIVGGHFSSRLVSTLRDSMKSLFQRYHSSIPVRERRHLTGLGLKPLVFVDTNILIDAVHAKIGEKLGLSHDLRLERSTSGHFHHMLRRFSNNNEILLFVSEVAESELRNYVFGSNRVRKNFKGIHINPNSWEEATSEASMTEIVANVLKEFRTWSPPHSRPEDSFMEEDVDNFYLQHEEVYDQLTVDRKARNPKAIRFEIGGSAPIYPEEGDQKLMLEAANLAALSLNKIGVILVASRDSDFTHVTRALEDSFGFSVVKNTRELQNWL
jgi:uncharacterized LabA/DUF88 family protein